MISPPRTLALDFGTVRIGVAISRGTLAEPLVIVPNQAGVIERIAELCQAEKIEQLIVGLSENEMAEKTKQFVHRLQQHPALASLPLEFVDETLSSHRTHQQHLESGKSLQQRRQPIDHLAAAQFLQEWLDEQ